MLFFKFIIYYLFICFAIVVGSTTTMAETNNTTEATGESSTTESPSQPTNATGVESNVDREYAKRKTKLNVLESKIAEQTKSIQKFIEIKKTSGLATDEKGNPVDVLETIASTHKKLKETIQEYNKERDELKYRYPEEGILIDRRYLPIRERTLEQIEKNTGLDSELTSTKKKIDKKYSIFVGDKLAKPSPEKIETTESTLRDAKKEQKKEAERIRFSQ